jgi:hypothetical protein
LSTGAEAFRVLTGGHQLVGEYRFCALTIKGLEREPENPYVAVFAPLLIEDDAELQARAPALWRTVQEAPVLPEVRALLSHVLEFWFFERFRGLTAGEIWAMLNLVTPIQETRAYQRGRLG